MDNDTYDDRHSTQQTFNKNIVKRIQELEDKRPSKLDDQVDIKLMKQGERIEELEEQVRLLEQYTIKGLTDSLRELQYNVDVKLERIDDILVVHSNQSDSQRKNHFQLQKVFSDKVMELLEGTHGKQK